MYKSNAVLHSLRSYVSMLHLVAEIFTVSVHLFAICILWQKICVVKQQFLAYSLKAPPDFDP
jgi:hypothetical protein